MKTTIYVLVVEFHQIGCFSYNNKAAKVRKETTTGTMNTDNPSILTAEATKV